MIGLGIAALALIAAGGPDRSSASPDPSRPRQSVIENVRIMGASPRPSFMSGVLRVFVFLDVRIGARDDLIYQPFMAMDQFVPPAGSTCTVTFRRERFHQPPSDPELHDVSLMVADALACDTGQFSMRNFGRPAQGPSAK